MFTIGLSLSQTRREPTSTLAPVRGIESGKPDDIFHDIWPVEYLLSVTKESQDSDLQVLIPGPSKP